MEKDTSFSEAGKQGLETARTNQWRLPGAHLCFGAAAFCLIAGPRRRLLAPCVFMRCCATVNAGSSGAMGSGCAAPPSHAKRSGAADMSLTGVPCTYDSTCLTPPV